jgi:HEAT repeat protein
MMKRAIRLVIGISATLALWAQVSPKAVRTADEMDPLLAKIATYEFSQSRIPLAQFTMFVQDSLTNPALLKQIEARLDQFVQSDATAAGKDFAFRELSLIATDASLPVLTPLLTDPAKAEMARYALSMIPGPAADEALRSSLAKATGNTKIGIINSLGQRHSASSVPALAPLAMSSDAGVAEAAAAALAQIADRPALDALAAARAKATGLVKQRIDEEYGQCAGQFAARGDKATTARVYRQLIVPQEPQMVRIMALGGLAAAEGTAAIPALVAEIESKDLKGQAAAIRLLGGIPGPEVTAAMVKEYPKLPPPGQVRLLSALAERGDMSVGPLFLSAAKDANPDVQASAIAGLGKVGDRSSVPVLAEAAANSQGAAQAAARNSLYNLRGPSIDPTIVSAIGTSSGKVKVELIMATGERGSTAAADALVKAVQEQDPDVHREALKALKNVAGPAQVPGLVDILVNATAATDRRDASQTLALVLKRSQPPQIGAVLAAYQKNTAAQARLSLMEVMGQTSSEQALPVLRDALKDPTAEIRRGAILAMTDWADAAPMQDLMAFAKGTASESLQVLALRGYLKLVALPSQRPDAESARLLGEAMTMAKQPAEKRQVLAILSNYPCKETLAIAQAAVADETVTKEAKAAVDKINSLLKYK